jgi:hypothetical protein
LALQQLEPHACERGQHWPPAQTVVRYGQHNWEPGGPQIVLMLVSQQELPLMQLVWSVLQQLDPHVTG